jgi:hypothetical protein
MQTTKNEYVASVLELELLGTQRLLFDRFRFSFSIREPDRERPVLMVLNECTPARPENHEQPGCNRNVFGRKCRAINALLESNSAIVVEIGAYERD